MTELVLADAESVASPSENLKGGNDKDAEANVLTERSALTWTKENRPTYSKWTRMNGLG